MKIQNKQIILSKDEKIQAIQSQRLQCVCSTDEEPKEMKLLTTSPECKYLRPEFFCDKCRLSAPLW